MDTETIIKAIDNLPAASRQTLMDRIARMLIEELASVRKTPGLSTSGRGGRKANGARRDSMAGDQGAEDQVLAYVKANPGQRTEEIGRGVGKDPKTALRKLRAAGLVRTKGEKRAMRYWMAGKAAK